MKTNSLQKLYLQKQQKIDSNQDDSQIDEELSQIDEKKKLNIKIRGQLQTSQFVLNYDKFVQNKDIQLIQEYEKRIYDWQTPFLEPKLKERQELYKQLKEITSKKEIIIKNQQSAQKQQIEQGKQQQQIEEIKQENILNTIVQNQLNKEGQQKQYLKSLSPEELKNAQNLENQIDIKNKELLKIAKILEEYVVGKEYYLRELYNIYQLDQQEPISNQLNFDAFVDGVTHLVLNGYPLELIDGDLNQFNQKVVSQIMDKIQKLSDQLGYQDPLFISVIGPQSTGKSTLLNLLFGCNFQTSAGRCTKGLNISALTVELPKDQFNLQKTQKRFLIILDTEGLLSIEKADQNYDKKLTLFSMASSQIMLINVNGELNESMKRIFEISLYAGTNLGKLTHKPTIYFILRNMVDLNKNKQIEMIDGIHQELIKCCEKSQVKLDDVLNFDPDNSFILLPSAYAKDNFNSNQKKQIEFQSVPNLFNQELDKFKTILFTKLLHISQTDKTASFQSLTSWVSYSQSIWIAISQYTDLFQISSIQEMIQREKLSLIYKSVSHEMVSQESFSKSLEQIYSKAQEDSKIISEKSALQDMKHKFNISMDSQYTMYFQKYIVSEQSNFQKQVKDQFPKDLIQEFRTRLEQTLTKEKLKYKDFLKLLFQKFENNIELSDCIKSVQEEISSGILKWNNNSTEIIDKNKQKELKLNIQQQVNIQIEKQKKKLLDDQNARTKEEKEKFKEFQQIVQDIFISVPDQKKLIDQTSFTSLQYRLNDYQLLNGAFILQEQNFQNKKEIKICIDKHVENLQIQITKIEDKNLLKRATDNQRNQQQLYSQYNQNQQQNYYNTIPNNQYSDEQLQVRLASQDIDILDQEIQKIWKPQQEKKVGNIKKLTNWFTNLIGYDQLQKQLKKYQSKQYRNAGIALHMIFLKYKEIINELKQATQVKINQNPKYLNDLILNYNEFIVSLNQQLKKLDIMIERRFFNSILVQLAQTYITNYTDDAKAENIKEIENFDKETRLMQDQLNKRFDSQAMDKTLSMELAQKLIKNVIKIIVSYHSNQLRQYAQNQIKKDEQDFLDECDKKYLSMDKDNVYKYITNPNSSYQDFFDKFYNDELTNLKQLENQKVQDSIIQTLQSLSQKIQDTYIEQQQQQISLSSFTPEFNQNQEQNKSYYIDLLFYQLENNEQKFKEALESIYQNNNKQSFTSKFNQIQLKIIKNPKEITKDISKDTYSVKEPQIFFESLKQQFIGYKIEQDFIQKLDLVKENQKQFDLVKETQRQQSIGCLAQCPYCGQKCDASQGHGNNHSTTYHRSMKFKGCREPAGKEGKYQFFEDQCDTQQNFQTQWRKSIQSSKGNKVNTRLKPDQANVAIRNQLNLKMGKLTFTLKWFNANDLDLKVTCGCEKKTRIYFGNPKCDGCGGFLDKDMNVCTCHQGQASGQYIHCTGQKCSASQPIENIYFSQGTLGAEYLILVNYCSGPKCNASEESKFELEIISEGESTKHIGTVSPSDRQKTYQFLYEDTLEFPKHVKEFYPDWQNIKQQNENNPRFQQKLDYFIKAWEKIKTQMEESYLKNQ